MITKSHLVSGLAPGRELAPELGRELGIWVPEARPAGAAVIRTYPMAGNFFHPPHPHAQAHHPIDFINPDCHLLGKTKQEKEKNACFETNARHNSKHKLFDPLDTPLTRISLWVS